ncbi:MAG: TRAP transporter substrate-binding protein [Betaproteobacteria bacterium]|nr:TRAP transporter substrate-binding protein [Betaproteobacteria bacterium]
MILKAAFVAASLFAASPLLGQNKPASPALNMLIGNATANDTQATVIDKFAELVTKYSNGRVTASARHGGALGNTTQMLAALQAGSLHGMIYPTGFMSTVVPELSLFDRPFLLPGVPSIIGFHGIGPQSLLTRFPVNKLADIQGKKLWAIPSPPRVGAHQDWGSVVRPMQFSELYSALQQGTLDGMEGPPDVLYRMKMHEVAKYYTVTEHFVVISNVIVSKKWFDGLPKDLQGVVTKAGKETIAFADAAYTKSQTASLEAMRKAITVTNMPAAELQKMKELAMKGVWERMKNDPQKGPIVKLLEEDVVRFNKE